MLSDLHDQRARPDPLARRRDGIEIVDCAAGRIITVHGIARGGVGALCDRLVELPMEIVEAARVDGSNEFRTFNRIVLPMLKPACAVQMIFSFVESWNNYFLPALILDKAEMKTVPIMIAQLRAADYSKFDLGNVYMFILLAILPVLIVYIFLSRFIIKGVTAGSVKG